MFVCLSGFKGASTTEVILRPCIKVLGCDGTAVNTGTTGGVCRLFELVTGSPVHWFICQLHGNELNLRHLFMSLDGPASGPRSFFGPIGKACAGDVWKGAVQQLSADQLLLLRKNQAII